MDHKKGIFIGCRLSSDSLIQLKHYCQLVGIIPKSISNEKTHITLLYSKHPLKSEYNFQTGLHEKIKAFQLRYIGKYAALMVQSPWLRRQQRILISKGGNNTFSGYIPHISLMKNPPPGLPLDRGSDLAKQLNLTVTSTYGEPLDE